MTLYNILIKTMCTYHWLNFIIMIKSVLLTTSTVVFEIMLKDTWWRHVFSFYPSYKETQFYLTWYTSNNHRSCIFGQKPSNACANVLLSAVLQFLVRYVYMHRHLMLNIVSNTHRKTELNSCCYCAGADAAAVNISTSTCALLLPVFIVLLVDDLWWFPVVIIDDRSNCCATHTRHIIGYVITESSLSMNSRWPYRSFACPHFTK